MKNSNICKFISTYYQDELHVKSFVYETKKAYMTLGMTLSDDLMILVINGKGVFSFGGELFSAEIGDIVFGFKGERFRIAEDMGIEYAYISFSGDRAEKLRRRYAITEATRLHRGFEGLIPLWKNTLASATEDNIDLAAESLLLYAFASFSSHNNERNRIIMEIADITDNKFADEDLSISGIADTLGYNAKYLSHLFKIEMGIPYSEYLRNIRIKYAVMLFDQGIDSVKNVAFLSGYKDPMYFSNVFKKVVGKSPKDYMADKDKGEF